MAGFSQSVSMRNYSMFLREAPHSSAFSLGRQKGCSLDVFQMIAWSVHAVWKFLSVWSESDFSGGGLLLPSGISSWGSCQVGGLLA